MEYISHYQLKEYNAFRTEAYAKLFCAPHTIGELRQAILDYPNEQKLVIGGGCNLFFTHDFDGLVIKPNLRGLHEISTEGSDDVLIEAMASEDWDSFVEHCVEKGYAGLENLSLIPGTVGAAPVQNIGAYGTEVKDYIQEVVALDINTGESLSFSNHECGFAYRDSLFKRTKKYVVVSVVFRLKKKLRNIAKYADLNKELAGTINPTILDVRNAVIRVRRRKLPDHTELPNCGSFFKNPYITPETAEKIKAEYEELPLYPVDGGLLKTSAAFLIDRAGFRGFREGNVGTYPNQALIIVNYGTSDGKDIVNVMNHIREAVNAKFGVMLEPEVWIF